jgi:hypothetical protein
MDSRLWLWPAGGIQGRELQGHAAPVSQVRVICALDRQNMRVQHVLRLLPSASGTKHLPLA